MNNDNDTIANQRLIAQLNILCEQQNITPTELARRTGVSQPTSHRILSGQSNDPKLSILRKLARGLGTNIAELEQETRSEDLISVPIIDWNMIGKDNYGQLSKLIPCPSKHGPNTFATYVNDNTMTSQQGRSYPAGSIIFIDPDQITSVKSGDRVLALIEGTIPTFKLYGETDGQRYLQSINLQYPIITREFEVKGLVIGMWMPEA